MYRLLGTALTLAVVLCVAPAKAGEYRDPAGFSLTYSDDWFVVANAEPALHQSKLPLEIQTWIKENKVDLSKMRVCLIHKGDGEYPATVNVVINRQQIPATVDSLKKLISALPPQAKAMGLPTGNLEARIEQVGKYKAIVVEHQSSVPGQQSPVRHKLVFFPGGGNTYIVTCSATPDSFARYSQAFEVILAGFQVSDPNVEVIAPIAQVPHPQVPSPVVQNHDSAGKIGWWDWRQTVVVAVIAGLIGGLVSLVKKFLGT